MHAQKTAKEKRIAPAWLPRALALMGIVALVALVLIFKPRHETSSAESTQPPEARIEQLLAEGKPAFLFFHSNNCYSCIEMIHVVEQVYPQYKDSLEMVDVNVYDEQNQNLLHRARITSIPTQIFLRSNGEGKVIIGVMSQEELHRELKSLLETANGD